MCLTELHNLIKRAQHSLCSQNADIILYDRDGKIKRAEFSAKSNEEHEKIRIAIKEAETIYSCDVCVNNDYSKVEECINKLTALRL